jgi:hypothetical protein
MYSAVSRACGFDLAAESNYSRGMVMNIVKLCVGVSSVEELETWRTEEITRRRAAGEPELIAHVTRMTPTKRTEIESGGSLYWVIAGVIQCRSEIVALEAVTGEDGIKRCAIMMMPELIRTAATPRRPFQGWRYLKPEDAPRDLSGPATGGEDLPIELRAKLLEIGAW